MFSSEVSASINYRKRFCRMAPRQVIWVTVINRSAL
jgi:hypothetical protein